MAKVSLDTTITDDALGADTLSVREKFLRKKRRVDTHSITLDGEPTQLTVQAMTQKEFDDLVAAHGKRRNKIEDEAIGANALTFPPALFAASVTDPELTQDEWQQIWGSPDWSPGELGHLLQLVMNTTSRGLDIPFGERG